MTELPEPAPYGPFNEADLQKVIDQLKVGEAYLFVGIYEMYAEVCRADGRRPCSKFVLGRELKRQGHQPGRFGPFGHRIWWIESKKEDDV